MNTWWAIGGIAVLLFGLAFFIPSNTLTGHIVQEGTCKGLGCVELCDADATSGAAAGAGSVCSDGLTCCPTSWDTGVCDYQVNCEKIREYSLYQSLETYQDSVRETPSSFDMQRFIIPLLVVLGILAYFIFKRNDPLLEVR